MGFWRLSAGFNMNRHSPKGIHRDVMDTPLKVQLQVLSFVAEELPLVDDDADFLG